MNDLKYTVQTVSTVFEFAAVAVIVGGAAVAAASAWLHLRARDGLAYGAVRATFGRGVLLGLEVLVAGDIIRTVVVAATLESLAVLASLVAIRTFLSWSLEVEIEGRWPWQRAAQQRAAAAEADAASEPEAG